MVKIATWNVNSIKVRLPHVLDWLKTAEPDILLLQELKCIEDNFPRMEIEDAGYSVAVAGQKTYNGVAILSKTQLEDVITELPGDDQDEQARYVEAVTDVDGCVLRVGSIYLPNGNPVDTEKYDYKLAWMDRLQTHAKNLLADEEVVVLAGDYNIIPEDADVWDPEAWRDDALFRMETRQKFRSILNLGYTEAFRALHSELGRYSFWDYQRGAWQKDYGIRIDHLLLSPQATDLLTACDIDKKPRGLERASDHTPVWCELTPK
ncbi:MAG: exodeoxyribonuclease III [Rhodospirillales bacterium]|nr:exodeoxyribonuclease III [Rhodospirillales bacterium]MBT4007001.1 exodeoxyribonuclease III [Rhodospirillales bacterium]MBT5075632.1 exodeoxyribonuclease III [Rhodospirillales bacterium]MBT5112861.1 exodeoxyribonuclease III [Rhodospirillales bacterium]MBT5673632.1 exodeoxyribonuclease III [Rhodospirillales bacterium]